MPRKHNQLTLTFKAVDCRYWKTKHPDLKESWSERGLLEFAHAPKEFQPDFQKLATNVGALNQLSELTADYDESQLRILIAALHDSFKLRAVGLRFGQAVYKNMSAPYAEYVDCFFRCNVVAIGPIIETVPYVYVTGSLDDIHGTLILVPADSLLSTAEFKKVRRKLEVEGKLKSPTGERHRLLRHTQAKAKAKDIPSIAEIADKLKDLESIDYDREPKRDAKTPAKKKKRKGPSSFTIS